ncbi:DivIVA domain-containing protein [Actinocorallia longicatena]
MEDQAEFGIRMFGYSRREVDAFLKEVRRELHEQSGGSGEVRVLTSSPNGEGAVARMLRMAAESAGQRGAEAAEQAERTVLAAREIADRIAVEAEELKRQARADADTILAEARQRAVDLEQRVSESLDREVRQRLGDLARTHNRLVSGLSGMRDVLVDVLDREAEQGPLSAMVPSQLRTG